MEFLYRSSSISMDVNSLKDIAKEARLLIFKLKRFGETGISGSSLKIKDSILENAIQLEQAFKNDLQTLLLNANKHDVTPDDDRHPKEDSVEDLKAEVDSILCAVNILQKQINKSVCGTEENCLTIAGNKSAAEEIKMDAFQGNNSTVATNEEMFNDSFYLSEDEDYFDNGGQKEQVVSEVQVSKNKLAECSTTKEVTSVDKLEAPKGEQLLSNTYVFSEPFFTQVESAFEKCINALSSVEYNTELFDEQPAKMSQTQQLVPHKNEVFPNLLSSDQITSSDELYAEACRPIERVMYGAESKVNCRATLSSNDFASANITSEVVDPRKGNENDDISTKEKTVITGLKDGRTSTKENSSHAPRSSSVPTFDLEQLAPHLETKVNVNSDSFPNTVAKSSVDKPGPLLNNSLQDEQLPGMEVVFDVPIHLQRPDWVLTVSERLGKSQIAMSKINSFSSAVKCRTRTGFNFLTTHLILSKGEKLRQIDFYEALASNRPVVSFMWISESLKEGKLLPCDPFLVWKRPNMIDEDECCDVQDFMLENIQICCIASFSGFSKGELRRLVEMCGGSFVLDPALFKDSRKCRNIALVERNDFDAEYEHQYKRANDNLSKFEVVSKEWLLDSIYEGRLLDTKDFLCEVPTMIT